MIKLNLYDKNSIVLKVSGTNNDFYDSLSAIKDMPVREYDKLTSKWTIPISDIIILKNKCKHKKIKFEYDESVKQSFQKYIEWRHNQNIIRDTDNFQDDWDIMKMKMYPFQTVGAQFTYEAGEGFILDHVGLGKTIQLLAVFEKYFIEKKINFGIIMCPSTLKRNWAEEIEKFTDREYFVVSGEKSKRKKQYKNAYKFDYMIINYDLLHWDIDLIDEFILQRGYEFGLGCDEVQYLKNHQAKRSKIAKQISDHSQHTIGLSATVLENNILDLWSVFHLVNQHVLGGKRSYYHFMGKFVETDWFGNPVGYKKGKLIKSKMKPYTIRRFKEDVLDDLPVRVDNNIWIELSKEQRRLYEEVKNNIATSLEDMEKAGRIQMAGILPMITYLRQCTLSTSLVGSNEIHSTKTDELLNFLESMDGNHKIVIFAHFIDMIELLYDKLTAAGYKVMAMHGENKKRCGVKMDDRVPKINEFNQSKELQILVTSDILSIGVNITSASYLINMDLLFNPAKMEQRIGRIDRIGNVSKKINIINFIATRTIEEKMYEIMTVKSNMSKDIMDDNRNENRLTVKTIRSILEL